MPCAVAPVKLWQPRRHHGWGLCVEIPQLLAHAVFEGASDLHLSAGSPPVLRIDGDMQPMDRPSLDHGSALHLIRSLMTEAQRGAVDASRDIDFSMDIAVGADAPVRCRVNAFMQNRGPAAVLRIISRAIPSLDDLGA